jgi:L-cysteine:1D-myo-inositol 2-amino-2-deoxy-alpha-D-glucopyranoside ligase
MPDSISPTHLAPADQPFADQPSVDQPFADQPMRLYDTARRAIVAFEPGEEVLMYTCGITPYDATHLGHAATFIAYDVLQRRLIDRGHQVTCVRNVTDVDDPLFAKARELGVHYLDLAAGQEARFERDMEALNALPVASTPRASSAISDIRGFIGMVLDRGFAYEAGGSVYFDVSKFPDFGSLSGYSESEMMDLAKQRGGNIEDPNKRNPLDFVLWHPSAADEPAWDTMWGAGRPGWHIECSALALRELGTTIDLHGGGADLIFPHHECERAQSEAATGELFVRHWMHTALISKDGHKMSKSLGNLVFVDALRAEWDPMVIRLLLIEHHYRTEWEWDASRLEANQARLDAWRAAAQGPVGTVLAQVRDCLDADLRTPEAVAAIDAAAARGESTAEAAALLGVIL